MNIGVNGRTFSVEEPGGAVQTSIELTEKLIACDSTDITIYGGPNSGNKLDTTICSELYPINSQVYGILWERTVLPYKIDHSDMDVFFCPSQNGPLFPISTPTILGVHDVGAERGWQSSIMQWYSSLTLERSVRSADIVTTVSEFSKQELLDTINIPDSKVQVVPNGVDELFLRDGGLKPLDLPQPYVLYVGAMNPRKNVTGAIKAFRKLKKNYNYEHKLVLIGPSNKMIFRNQSIIEDEDILYKGFVSKSELKYAYTNADVFVFPSLYEGFGLPPLEAMACGTPVVASNYAALPEILGGAAELVDPEDTDSISDSLALVIDDNEYSQYLIIQGYKQVNKYRWEKCVDKYINIANELF